MSVVSFPTSQVRATCFACFDFTAGDRHTCPVCGRGTGKRLDERDRPQRPSMFRTIKQEPRP